MAADNADFANAQKIHDLLVEVACQGSKDDALRCHAMDLLDVMLNVTNHRQFLFEIAIAVQFGPVQSVASDGARADVVADWGENTLSQEDIETAQRIEEMLTRYNETHCEGPIDLAVEDKDDPNQGMSG